MDDIKDKRDSPRAEEMPRRMIERKPETTLESGAWNRLRWWHGGDGGCLSHVRLLRSQLRVVAVTAFAGVRSQCRGQRYTGWESGKPDSYSVARSGVTAKVPGDLEKCIWV